MPRPLLHARARDLQQPRAHILSVKVKYACNSIELPRPRVKDRGREGGKEGDEGAEFPEGQGWHFPLYLSILHATDRIGELQRWDSTLGVD